MQEIIHSLRRCRTRISDPRLRKEMFRLDIKKRFLNCMGQMAELLREAVKATSMLLSEVR